MEDQKNKNRWIKPGDPDASPELNELGKTIPNIESRTRVVSKEEADRIWRKLLSGESEDDDENVDEAPEAELENDEVLENVTSSIDSKTIRDTADQIISMLEDLRNQHGSSEFLVAFVHAIKEIKAHAEHVFKSHPTSEVLMKIVNDLIQANTEHNGGDLLRTALHNAKVLAIRERKKME